MPIGIYCIPCASLQGDVKNEILEELKEAKAADVFWHHGFMEGISGI